MRRWLDRGFTVTAALAGGLAAAILLGLVGTIVWRALPALSLELLVTGSLEAGAAGGVLYQLLGTMILIVTALSVAAPLAVGLALAEAVYLPARKIRRRFQLALYLWNGLPSILMGIFGLLVFGKLLGWGKSWLAGGIVLGFMILPTVTVSLAERMRAIPPRYLEAAAGLGLTRSQVVRSVVLPQSLPGLLSGSLLGLARAAGETAPILFTAAVFSGVTLPDGIKENPVVALPYHIFVLAQDSLDPEAGSRLWGAAVVLLGLVFTLSLVALPARLASHEEARHA